MQTVSHIYSNSLADYVIQQKPIGEGSFGKVYKATLKNNAAIEFAIKYIDKKGKKDKQIQGFKSQTEIMRKLSHPNIIALRTVIETDLHLIIIMQYAETDFSKFMEKKKKLSVSDIKKYGFQILQALLYLKQHKIIHRDLKPQNILFHKGHVKLCDFGFAKQMSASTAYVTSMKGTPLYLAPQIIKSKPYNSKVDIWSFGIILYELFSGKQPFYATTWLKLVPKILNNTIFYPQLMPPDLKDLIDKMLKKSPESRLDHKQVKQHKFFIGELQQYEKQLQEFQKNHYTPGQIDGPKFQQVKINGLSQISNYQNLPQLKKQEKSDKTKLQDDLKQLIKQIDQVANDILQGKQNSFDIALKIKTNQQFGLKIDGVFQIKLTQQLPIPKQTLSKIYKLLSHLITKVKLQKNDCVQQQDITKNIRLIFSIIKIAEQQTNQDLLLQQLSLLGLMIRNNFNGDQLDMDTQDKIRQLISNILKKSNLKNLKNNQCNKSPINKKVFINCLKIIGILVNQALLTFQNSFQFFQQCEKSRLLQTVAQCYQSSSQYFVIVMILQLFLHPTNTLKTHVENKLPDLSLTYMKQQTLNKIKTQVADVLAQKDFIHPQKSPFQIYQNSGQLQTYFKVLYQCLKISQKMRILYQNYEKYWLDLDLFDKKNLKIFAYANNDIIIKYHKKKIYTNQLIRNQTIKQKDNKFIKVLMIKNAFFNYQMRPDSNQKSQFGIQIIEQILQLLKTDQKQKLLSIKQLQGNFANTKYSLFDEQLIEIMSTITTNQIILSKQSTKLSLIQILDTSFNNMKPQNINVQGDYFKLSQKILYKYLRMFINCNQFKKNEQSFQKKILNSFTQLISYQSIRQVQIKNGKQFTICYFLTLYELLRHGPIFSSGSLKRGIIEEQLYQKVILKSFESKIYEMLFDDFENLNSKKFYQQTKQNEFGRVGLSLQFVNRMIMGVGSSQRSIIIQFVGYQVLPNLKEKINSKKTSVQSMKQIILLISNIAKNKADFDQIIVQTNILSQLDYLLSNKFTSIGDLSLRQDCLDKILNMIGNMTKNKKNKEFFDSLARHQVMPAVKNTILQNFTNKKIVRNGIFAIGNLSFWTDKFYKQISPLIPLFKDILMNWNAKQEEAIINNLISTLTNLVRHSSIYLDILMKQEIIYIVLKKYIIQSKCENNKQSDFMKSCWNFIKKALTVGKAFDPNNNVKKITDDYQLSCLMKIVVKSKHCIQILKGFDEFKTLSELYK